MNRVGSCAHNAAAEGFLGLLKRKRGDRRQSQTRAEARADVFDFIERFHNPRRTRRVEQPEGEEAFIKPSVEKASPSPRFSISCGETVSATRRRDHFVAGFFRFIVGYLRGESRSKGLDANGLFEPLDDVG